MFDGLIRGAAGAGKMFSMRSRRSPSSAVDLLRRVDTALQKTMVYVWVRSQRMQDQSTSAPLSPRTSSLPQRYQVYPRIWESVIPELLAHRGVQALQPFLQLASRETVSPESKIVETLSPQLPNKRDRFIFTIPMATGSSTGVRATLLTVLVW